MASDYDDTPQIDVREICKKLEARAKALGVIGMADPLSLQAARMLHIMSCREMAYRATPPPQEDASDD